MMTACRVAYRATCATTLQIRTGSCCVYGLFGIVLNINNRNNGLETPWYVYFEPYNFPLNTFRAWY